MKAHLNGNEIEVGSEEELSECLDQIDSYENLEAWIMSPSGPSICLLKNGDYTLLMYLRSPGDSGFVSDSQSNNPNAIEFTMANGQVDEYPLSWCVNKEQAYKAFAHFYVNSGEQSPHIKWQAS